MKHIYFDERGDNGLNFEKEGTSPFFFVAAVIIDENEANEVKKELDNISRLYFGGGPIKSQTIADNHERRNKIISEINKLKWYAYVLVVNKRLLYSPGFEYKTVFYKNINNRVYSYLINAFPKSSLIADQHGSKEFMESFLLYVEDRNDLNLFNPVPFSFGRSKENRFIQLADLIVGTTAKEYKNNIQFFNKTRVVIDFWPPKEFDINDFNVNDEYDRLIIENAIKFAEKFIETNNNVKEHWVLDQCNFLRLLLYKFKYDDFNAYVPCHEIKKYIANARGLESISSYYLGTKVIGKLRDSRILIASNKVGGYKIPSGIKDIFDFVININGKVFPMLERINTFQKHILLLTQGKIDILQSDELKHLRLN